MIFWVLLFGLVAYLTTLTTEDSDGTEQGSDPDYPDETPWGV